MAGNNADKWVRLAIGVLAMLMVGAAVLKFGDKMNEVGWTIAGIAFVIIALASILPPKTYLEALKSINFAAMLAAIRGRSPGGKGSDDGTKPPTVPPPGGNGPPP